MNLNLTISTILILPTVGVSRSQLEQLGFINAYIKDKNNESYGENHLFLLFKPESKSKFDEFLSNQYISNEFIVDNYSYDGNYEVIVYALNLIWKNDYEIIKKGQYSKLSKEYKSIFPKTVKINGVNRITLQWLIFDRNSRLKNYIEDKIGTPLEENAELWDIWDNEKETLDIEKIKNDNRENAELLQK